MVHSISIFTTTLLLAMTTVISIDVPDFFPSIKNNLTKIIWAHAVNNKNYLHTTLNDDHIMMIEADVSMGTKNPSETVTYPIMAHPPNKISDLTLEEFLNEIKQFNKKKENENRRKGVKLDFKSIVALEESVQDGKLYENIDFPLWINSDILSGPIMSPITPIDPIRFFEFSRKIGDVTLSLGWTTFFKKGLKGSYTEDQVREMQTVIRENNVDNPITFAVRACYASESKKIIKELLDNVQKSTLTIWSSPGDEVDVKNLQELIEESGLNKVYIDLPEELREKLRLH